MTKALLKSVSLRFLRAFLAGAVSNLIILAPFSGNSWKDVGTWIAALTLSATVGGVTGVIMAADKYFRADY